MPTLDHEGVPLAYQIRANGDPVLLILQRSGSRPALLLVNRNGRSSVLWPFSLGKAVGGDIQSGPWAVTGGRIHETDKRVGGIDLVLGTITVMTPS